MIELSILDGDYVDIEPTEEELNSIDEEQLIPDEDDYHIDDNLIANLSHFYDDQYGEEDDDEDDTEWYEHD
jgi:hypothetical protein